MTTSTASNAPAENWYVESYTDYRYLDSDFAGLRFSQGLVWNGDANEWVSTWQYGMARLTPDFDFTQTTGSFDLSTFTEINGIPQALQDMGMSHIGDIDYYDGKLYVSLDNEGADYNDGHVAIFNASDLSYTGQVYELVGAPSNPHHDVASWVAVDGAAGLGYGKEWQNGNTINVYNLADWSFKTTLTMDQSLKNIQGAKVLDGIMYMSADIGTRSVYSLDLATGHVEELFELPAPANTDQEVEGLEVRKNADGKVEVTVELIIDPEGDSYGDTYTRLFTYVLGDGQSVPLTHTWTVNTASDTTNANDLSLTLREAIAKAEAGDTITFDASLAGQTITLGDAELALSKNITIEGDLDGDGKSDITISGGTSSVIHVTGGNVTLDGLVVLHDEETSSSSITVDGDATVVFTNGATTNLATAGDDVLTGSAGMDVIHGGAGDDIIQGLRGNDILYGNGGNDTLIDGAGTDTLVGGNGNDTYIVSNQGDVVTELKNGGTDIVKAAISYTLGANVENLTLTGTADIDGTGNELANVITGNGGANTLSGLGGNDTLNGGRGADTMIGGTGNDTYIVDASGDTVTETSTGGIDTVKSSISYTLGANVENLSLKGLSALNGTGNASDNVLIGSNANNILVGLAGNDTIRGGAGDDTLTGGLGHDNLIGGKGADTFVFALADMLTSKSKADTIFDMHGADGDRIDLHTIDANEAKAGNQSFTFIGNASFSGHDGELRFVKEANDTYIYGDTDGDKKIDFAIHLNHAMTLTADYFVL